ncbi:MAG: ARPP-1 family domain-containing protein, partial [Kofleriaceae bacterium]
APIHDGRLTLVPIVAVGSWTDERFLTLQDGMATGRVKVTEHREFDYASVVVHNRSNQRLLVLRGELLLDGYQDRVAAETTVLAAGATAPIQVRCVEPDRDRGKRALSPGHALAELSLRRVLAQGIQERVWEEVNRINARHDLHPATHTYRQAAARHTSGEVAGHRDQLAAQLWAHPDRDRMVGLVGVLDGRPVAIDRFASPALYRQVEARLLASYAASDAGPPAEGQPLTFSAIRELAQIPDTRWTTEASFTAIRPMVEPVAQRKVNPADPWE